MQDGYNVVEERQAEVGEKRNSKRRERKRRREKSAG